MEGFFSLFNQTYNLLSLASQKLIQPTNHRAFFCWERWRVVLLFQCDNKRQHQKKKVSFIFNCSITWLIASTTLRYEFQAKYNSYYISDQIPILFHTVLQHKNEFIKFSSFQNFPAGAGTHSSLLKDFPTPRCCHLQQRDTVDFVQGVLENSGAEQGQGYVMYCSLSRAHSLSAQQSTRQLLLFVCRLQSKYCRAHSKTRLRTECYFRTATCYTARSFPFCPLPLKKRVKKKKIKKDTCMTSGALEMQA